jgi:hypothetical protein
MRILDAADLAGLAEVASERTTETVEQMVVAAREVLLPSAARGEGADDQQGPFRA